jgi:hypothetical protein
MIRHLTKTATASVLAVALALTTVTATPADANGHRRNNGAEAAAIFGGLLLLYGLSQAGRNNTVTRHQPPPPAVIPLHPQPLYPAPPLPRQTFRVAPAYCYVEGYDNGGFYRGYRARCMEDSVPNPHLLPAQCLRQVWTERGQRRIYGAHCLTQYGWTQG